MSERKPGELIEIFGDFWLGMAGAAAKGVSRFSEIRREEKEKEKSDFDFFEAASEAFTHVTSEAQAVAASTVTQLKKD
jgi:hypothetical protein